MMCETRDRPQVAYLISEKESQRRIIELVNQWYAELPKEFKFKKTKKRK